MQIILIIYNNIHKKTLDVNQGLAGDPTGNRTRVTAVKGRCLRPLDHGAIFIETLAGLNFSKVATSYFPGQSPTKYLRR